MKHISNLTDRNRQALAALPAGFPVEVKVLGPYNPSDWETVTVVEFQDEDAEGFSALVVESSCAVTGEPYVWRLCETAHRTGVPHLASGSGCEAVSVRWSPEALALFLQLGGESFAGVVLSVLS